MKKIIKGSIILCLLCCLITSAAYAGDSDFGETKVKYQTHTTGKDLTSTGSVNKKATSGADWFFRVDALRFTSTSISGTLGMMYVPGLCFSYAPPYTYLVAADPAWTKTAFSGYRRKGWGGNEGEAGTIYTLCVRMDNLIRDGYGYTKGVWNSN